MEPHSLCVASKTSLNGPRNKWNSWYWDFRCCPLRILVVARMRYLYTYLLHSNAARGLLMEDAAGEWPHPSPNSIPVSLNLLQGFIPTFAMHCSVAFVRVTWVHFRGWEKGEFWGRKSSTFLSHKVPLFILLKPLWFPFPLLSPVCLFRRVEIGFVCDALSCLLQLYTVLLSMKMILQSYGVCWYSFCSRKWLTSWLKHFLSTCTGCLESICVHPVIVLPRCSTYRIKERHIGALESY